MFGACYKLMHSTSTCTSYYNTICFIVWQMTEHLEASIDVLLLCNYRQIHIK